MVQLIQALAGNDLLIAVLRTKDLVVVLGQLNQALAENDCLIAEPRIFD
jgi:hypothetical protein